MLLKVHPLLYSACFIYGFGSFVSVRRVIFKSSNRPHSVFQKLEATNVPRGNNKR